MKKNDLLLVFILLPALLAPACATEAEKPYFINPADLPPQLLPPPPSEGTPVWKKQAAAVEAAQTHIDASDHIAMRAEQRVTLDMMLGSMPSGFNREHLPKTFAMLDHVLNDTRLITDNDKTFWHTRRPYLADKNVKLGVDPLDNSPAYPSGHTTASRVLAEVLGLLYPDRQDILRARASDIARHRIEAGVHYPNDIEGGKLLAMLIVGGLLQNDDFHDMFLSAQSEISRARQ